MLLGGDTNASLQLPATLVLCSPPVSAKPVTDVDHAPPVPVASQGADAVMATEPEALGAIGKFDGANAVGVMPAG